MKSAQLRRVAEISYRQLDHWCRQGYIRPTGAGTMVGTPGKGTDRDFSEAMAQKARIMACLIKLGWAVDAAEPIAQKVALENCKTIYLGHGVTVTVEPHKH